MKKIAIIGLLACAALTGCGGDVTISLGSGLTPVEKAVYAAYWKQDGAFDNYRGFMDETIKRRPESLNASRTGFFCDSLDALKAADFGAYNRNDADAQTLSKVFEVVYKTTPEKACGVYAAPKAVVNDVPVVRVDTTQDVLGPDLYDKMIEVANSCGRSRQYLIDLTAKKEYLTRNDYDAVMKSYMSCKKFELEKALQEN
ncbi:hypothetical protein MQM1_071 [Aeromonas phage vB_AsaP_MQM1]|nr:hypothetical protein MQM1_071 [Aeromonas phage vB_AsaP_MQM1]